MLSVQKNLFKFRISRTNKMLSVQKNLFKFRISRTNKMLSVQKIYSSLESVEQIKSCQFKIYSSLTVVLLRKSYPKTVKVKQ